MNRLSMEHPTVLRTRSSHGRVCEEFNFPQGWSSQALSQVSLHVPWALDDWDGSTGVSPVHGCLHRSLCLAVLQGLLAASRSSPDVSTATAGQGSISLSHSRAAQLGQPDLCCVSFPARRHAPKAKKQAQSSFAQVKNKLPWGRARSDPCCKLRGNGRTHTQGRRSQLVPSSVLLFHSNKSRGGAGIPGCFLQEGAWGAGTELLPGCACSSPR